MKSLRNSIALTGYSCEHFLSRSTRSRLIPIKEELSPNIMKYHISVATLDPESEIKSHTCEYGAHLRISFWNLLIKLKNNHLLKKLLKWAEKNRE